MMHMRREQLPGSEPGTWRFVYWCGEEQDKVALSPHGGMSSNAAPPKCPDCEKSKVNTDDATD